jgi:hypothetical protein
MIRDIEIVVNRRSWPSKSVPPEISSLAGKRTTNINRGLVHTALRTRPPEVHGFHLSDIWAWERYSYALDSGPGLRLRPEWQRLDPHQKTIMSDELGMGLTTQLLAEELDFVRFVDTNYYVRVAAPKHFKFMSKNKTGPAKSPDFIAEDGSGRLNVVECKGSQSSISSLRAAMKKGIVQKKNIKPGNRRTHHSLVVGLYIPQANSSSEAVIRISDPSWAALESILVGIEEKQQRRSIVQIDLATHLALLGLSSVAGQLSSTPTEDLIQLSRQSREELERFETTPAALTREILSLEPAESDFLAPTRISITAPENLSSLLLSSPDLRELLDKLRDIAPASPWQIVDQNNIETSMGFRVEFA